MSTLKFACIEVQKTVPGSSKNKAKGFGYTETYFEVYYVKSGAEPLLCQEFSLRSPIGQKPKAKAIQKTISEKMKFMYSLMAADHRLESDVYVELPAVYMDELEFAIDEIEIEGAE